ncbi:MAG TPA: pantoate--beta-alanine ligase, partial [Gemmatimonadaceae bacterium]
ESVGAAVIRDVPAVRTDYLAIVNTTNFQRENPVKEGFAAIVAARVGATRLIDNTILGADGQD